MEYEAVIGLETHVQLKTRTKMWCGCANTFGAEPNSSVCPVCLGLPGVLPVANEEALKLTALTGMLLHCDIPALARFDRKNYFYPDVPKNYQITQLDRPSNVNGHLDFEFEGAVRRVRITRAHLEEDVGKNFHFDRESGVDFNRAGVPLLEIVSEPDLTGADMAHAYLNALRAVLEQGGVSDCDMEKGMVRCDLNVSVRPVGTTELGSKVEIKNMNTFSGARKALAHEIERQVDVLRSGGSIPQETRRWDDVAGITESMRSKEHAHDYRYFPEPDLMPFEPTAGWLEEVRSRVVELPLERKRRLMTDFELPDADAEILAQQPALGRFFEEAVQPDVRAKAVANWIINNLQSRIAESGMEVEEVRIQPGHVAELVRLIDSGKINGKIAQDVFQDMFTSGDPPGDIVERRGLSQVSDAGAIEAFCDEVIQSQPRSVEDFRNGKAAALNFLKGQVMKLSRGKANPKQVGEILERKILA